MTGVMERRVWMGTGAGQALGVVNAPATIVQAIEGTQTIANTPTFIATNAAKMLGQMLDPQSACFFVNPELLTAMASATVNSNEKTLLTPPDAEAPFGRLLTRPIFPNPASPAVGTVGDFVCASMENYLVVQHGDVRKDISIHVRFLQDEQLFRFAFRWNGAPMLSSAYAPAWSSTLKSHYVALAARS
jgi:HK97 family phage major capsid protein